MKIETIAVHAGYKPDPVTKAVVPPIYQTVAYAFDSAQHGADLFDLKVAGNIYTRIMNPTQSVLEERVAALEGGIAALALASGQAAITYAIQTIAEAGDNIVSSSALYGGTYNLFAHTFPQFLQLIQYLNHVANFQLQFVIHVAWYQGQRLSLPPSNSDTYLIRYGDRLFLIILRHNAHQWAMV